MKGKDEIIEWLIAMEPFVDEWHIPSPPKMENSDYLKYVIPNYVRCGAIPKKDLKANQLYLGSCRNASKARWNGEKFTYIRHKWGSSYEEDINHFEDDDGYDLFVPIKLCKDEAEGCEKNN